jgi:phosphoglycerate dehydrogenase-like enzyme
MPVEPQTITWRHHDGAKSVVVAGASWFTARLPATLPGGEFRGYVASEPDAVVVERASLAAVADELLLATGVVILIDPEDRERWHVESLLAGRRTARIVVLPSVAAVGAAEHALLFALTLSRRLLPAYSELVAGTREEGGANGHNWAGLPEVGTLSGKTLGIIGLGRSGRALAERALGCGLRVIYHDIARKPREEARFGIESRRFDQLLREADILSLHPPPTPETLRLIDAPELAAMKPTALLLNVADGRLIDEGALIKALRQGDIAGAGLDAFAYEPLAPDSPLIGFENVILTPGVAWISEETEHAGWLARIRMILDEMAF